MTNRHLISLGANLGDAKQTLVSAIDIIRSHFGQSAVRASRLYRTPPVGGPSGQGEFHNAVVAIDSRDDPFAIWRFTRDIETKLGRVRNQRWEARRIDIDLLLSGDQQIWTPHLKVPHPRMMMRKFILEPAVEVAGDWIDPVSGITIEKLREACDQYPKCVVVFSHDRELIHSVLTNTAQIPKRITEHDFDGYRLDLSFDQTVIAVVCQPDELSKRLPAIISSANEIVGKPRGVASANRANSIAFLAAAVASPDITTIAWEDSSKPWANSLGITAPSSHVHKDSIVTSDCRLPRYLLDASDPKWAAHELVAAFDAMNCHVEAL